MLKPSVVNNKKYFFFSAFFVYTCNLVLLPLFVTLGQNSMGALPTGAPMAAMICGVSFVINLSMRRQKIFHNRGIRILFIGVFLYLSYAGFISFSGVTLFSTARAYREIASLSAFSVTLFFASRLIIAYDWKVELLRTVCLALGLSIVAAYIMHFDNFAFVSKVGNLFQARGRYRYGFGFDHVNTAGRYCLLFFEFSALYRVAVEERLQSTQPTYTSKKRIDRFNAFFIFPASIVAFVMLLSTASRTSITSLILFYMVYTFLTLRAELGKYMRVILIMAVIVVVITAIFVVDWNYVYQMSSRASNYTTIEMIVGKNAWLTGLGLIKSTELNEVTRLQWLDSYYLLTFLQTGLIGFVILFATIFSFVKIYFNDIDSMTKFQRLTGALLAVYLYYGLFESVMYGHGFSDMTGWILFITAINQKSSPNPVKYSTHILHNS